MPDLDLSLPEGWSLLTAYQRGGNGLLKTVGATDSVAYQCTVYPKGRSPISATGKTPREAIENAELRLLGADATSGGAV